MCNTWERLPKIRKKNSVGRCCISMVALLNYVEKRRCTIAGITVLSLQNLLVSIRRDNFFKTMFCLNSNNSIPEIHPGPDICAWVHRRSCTGDVEKPGLFHKMLWADLIKPIFESCAWPHWIPVQREVRSRWLPRSKERGEIYFSAPGKFCPSCGHQVTYNQILKMKKCQYKTSTSPDNSRCGTWKTGSQK